MFLADNCFICLYDDKYKAPFLIKYNLLQDNTTDNLNLIFHTLA